MLHIVLQRPNSEQYNQVDSGQDEALVTTEESTTSQRVYKKQRGVEKQKLTKKEEVYRNTPGAVNKQEYNKMRTGVYKMGNVGVKIFFVIL